MQILEELIQVPELPVVDNLQTLVEAEVEAKQSLLL